MKLRSGTLLLAMTIAIVGSLLAFDVAAYSCAGSGLAMPQSVRADDDGVLHITGPIDDTLVKLTKRALAETSTSVRRVVLDSVGGQVTRMDRLAEMLRLFHARMEVAEHGTCQSACVGLLATSESPILVPLTATLMFHSAATHFGLAGAGPCGWVNAISDAIGRGLASVFGADDEPIMLPWAERLSPRLPELFHLCPVDPLTTQQGLLLTGIEYQGLQSGSIRPSQLTSRCPRS